MVGTYKCLSKGRAGKRHENQREAARKTAREETGARERAREIDGGEIKARTGMENRKDERGAGQKVCPKESR